MGDQLWVDENDSGHKSSFFFKLNPFSEGKYLNSMTRVTTIFGIWAWQTTEKARHDGLNETAKNVLLFCQLLQLVIANFQPVGVEVNDLKVYQDSNALSFVSNT